MTFNSIDFLLFFPLVILIYYIVPVKLRYIWLLIASYYFYSSWNVRYIIYLVPISFITYILGLALEWAETGGAGEQRKRNVKRLIIAVGTIVTIGILGILKYTDFFIINLNRIMIPCGITLKEPEWDLLLPVGISFYTLQALGYLIDIYRGKTHAEKNIFRYALFLAFFPTIMSGPVERAGNLLKQLQGKIYLKVENLRYGLLSLAWGLFLKLVVADNMAVIVNGVIGDWQSWKGCEIAMAVVIFGAQIYCDFNGYSQMAVGTAKILGIDIIKNFSAPYLAENVKEFWRRWHISLTSWFTEYLYIPLGGNRKGTVRKYINTLIVFGISGLWHGASLNFVAWGLLNGIYLIIYDMYSQIQKKRVPDRRLGTRVCKSILTFLAVDFAWLFFVMPDMGEAIGALLHSIQNFKAPWLFSEGIFNMFPGRRELFNILVSSSIVFGVDNMEYRGIDFREAVFGQNKAVRWLIYLFLTGMIILYGAYGGDYQQKAFIYFEF